MNIFPQLLTGAAAIGMLFGMVKIAQLKKCPSCGSRNLTYMDITDAWYCNGCGDIFRFRKKW